MDHAMSREHQVEANVAGIVEGEFHQRVNQLSHIAAPNLEICRRLRIAVLVLDRFFTHRVRNIIEDDPGGEAARLDGHRKHTPKIVQFAQLLFCIDRDLQSSISCLLRSFFPPVL